MNVDLDSIAERLRAEVPALRHVGGAAEFVAAVDHVPAVPAAFVLPLREDALDSPFMDGFVQQVVGCEFVVMLVARDLSDAAGGAAVQALAPLRKAVAAALLGWTPTGAEAGVEYRGGAFQAFDEDNNLWWQETYRTAFIIRSA